MGPESKENRFATGSGLVEEDLLQPNGLDSLSFGRFLFRFRAKQPIHLPPFKGSLFRGVFGLALRRISCPASGRRQCAECLMNGECAYSYLFETPNTREGDLLEAVSHAPHPFILRPPLSHREVYAIGEHFELQIILIGKALRLIPHVIYAFEELAMAGVGPGRGKLELEAVFAHVGQSWEPIYHGSGGGLTKLSWEITMADIVRTMTDASANSVEIAFKTPIRIRSQGSITDSMDFTLLMINLLRRFHLLDRYHGAGKLTFDHGALIACSKQVRTVYKDLRWIDTQRYSARQKVQMNMGGVLGSIEFSGPLTVFLPYLTWGEILHVGKGTSFGMGMYDVAFDDIAT